MATVSRILVPVDFGEPAFRALEYGRTLADACGASLHLLYVIPYPAVRRDHEQEDRERACARLAAFLDETDRVKRRATTDCRVGATAAEIVRYAEENGVDLVVMGTHRHGPTCQMLTGSIAESVIETAPCAVLAVKGPVERHRDAAFDRVGSVQTGEI